MLLQMAKQWVTFDHHSINGHIIVFFSSKDLKIASFSFFCPVLNPILTLCEIHMMSSFLQSKARNTSGLIKGQKGRDILKFPKIWELTTLFLYSLIDNFFLSTRHTYITQVSFNMFRNRVDYLWQIHVNLAYMLSDQ